MLEQNFQIQVANEKIQIKSISCYIFFQFF